MKKFKRGSDNFTIDLKEMHCIEYIESKKTRYQKIKERAIGFINTVAMIWLILCILFAFGGINPGKVNSYYNDLSIQDKIRLERLKICQEVYKSSEIREYFLYGQVPAVRCATYMTLVYAYESGFGKSKKCIQTNNCFGIKGNGVDTPKGFLKFKTQTEGRKYFANKYFQWHYKKDINRFIYSWSMTDREAYIFFMKTNYWTVYSELENLYLTN